MEGPYDSFLKLFLLNMCPPKIIALLVPVHFMFIREREILAEGFALKNILGSYSFVEAALTTRF